MGGREKGEGERLAILLQPCTLPTTLYRLLKKVNQSFSTVCSLSPKSLYSGLQSSGLSDDCARARDASFPAKPDFVVQKIRMI